MLRRPNSPATPEVARLLWAAARTPLEETAIRTLAAQFAPHREEVLPALYYAARAQTPRSYVPACLAALTLGIRVPAALLRRTAWMYEQPYLLIQAAFRHEGPVDDMLFRAVGGANLDYTQRRACALAALYHSLHVEGHLTDERGFGWIFRLDITDLGEYHPSTWLGTFYTSALRFFLRQHTQIPDGMLPPAATGTPWLREELEAFFGAMETTFGYPPERVPELLAFGSCDLRGTSRLAPVRKSGKHGTANAPVGRNDPCPCGSGKKYKKCCLATGSRPLPRALPASPAISGSHPVPSDIPPLPDLPPEADLRDLLEADWVAAGEGVAWSRGVLQEANAVLLSQCRPELLPETLWPEYAQRLAKCRLFSRHTALLEAVHERCALAETKGEDSPPWVEETLNALADGMRVAASLSEQLHPLVMRFVEEWTRGEQGFVQDLPLSVRFVARTFGRPKASRRAACLEELLEELPALYDAIEADGIPPSFESAELAERIARFAFDLLNSPLAALAPPFLWAAQTMTTEVPPAWVYTAAGLSVPMGLPGPYLLERMPAALAQKTPKNAKAASRDAALLRALKTAQQRVRELEIERRDLEEQLAAARQTSCADTGASSAQEELLGLRLELVEVRRRFAEKKEELRARHEEVRRLRAALASAQAALDSHREPKEQASADEDAPPLTDEPLDVSPDVAGGLDLQDIRVSRLPVRVPVIEPKRVWGWDAAPARIQRATVALAGRLAAGEPAAWRGVKHARRQREVLFQRVGIHYRLLFRVDDTTLRCLALCSRETLWDALTHFE